MHRRLRAYSLSALAFAAFQYAGSSAHAQSFIRDFDPDLLLDDNGDTIHLDFNGDGIFDIRFELHSFFSITGYYSNYSFKAEAHPLHSGLQFGILSSFYPRGFATLETIGPAGSFSDGPFLPLYDYTGASGAWLGVTNAFLGFRLLEIDGWHYGWVRLKINYGSATIKSYGYNLTADEELTAGIAITPPGAVNTIISSVTDPATNNPVSDVDVQFYRATDESTVSEYRAMIVPADSSAAFEVATAELAPTSGFLSFAPGGSNPDTVNLGAITTDAYGSTLEYYRDYVVFILSMADGVNATINTLSEASEVFSQELVTGPMGSLIVSDIGNANLGEDVYFDFNPAAYESAVAEYRLMYSIDGSPLGIFPASLLSVPPSLYKALSITDPKTGDLSGLDHYIEGDKIELGRPMNIFVLALGTAEEGSSYSGRELILSDEDWMVNDLAYNLPVTAASFAEMTVSFQPAAADSLISQYRVCLSRFETLSSPYWAAQQSVDNYVVAIADGSGGFTADLASLSNTIQGYPIYQPGAQALIVLSVGDTIGNELSYADETVYVPSLVIPQVSASVDFPFEEVIQVDFSAGPLASTNRVMLVKNEDAADFDTEAARLVPTTNSRNMISSATTTEFNLGELDVSGDPIVAYQDYRVFVLSVLTLSATHPEPSYLSEPSSVVSIGSSTGLESLQNPEDILTLTVSDGILAYSIESTSGQSIKAEVIDLAGRLVWSSEQRLEQSGQVDLRHLPRGIYHFRIWGGQWSESRKFVR